MKFKISCETYYRLSRILAYFDPKIDKEIHNKLHCIRLENVDGVVLAIATNQKIAVIEKIGHTNQPNGIAHLVVNEQLINQCKNEKAYNSILDVIVIPEIAVASATTMFGYNYPGNACIFPNNTPMDNWRDWAHKEDIEQSNGAMYWNLTYMLMLNESCPSGEIVFPAYIDIDKPVVLRDINNDSWVGLFMPADSLGKPELKPAILPQWWNK